MTEYQVQEVIGIESLIRSFRGVRVMSDSDLAKNYGVSTMRLNARTLAFTATGLLNTLASMMAPCPVNTHGNLRRPPPVMLPEDRRKIGFLRETAPRYRVGRRCRR